MMSVLAEVSTTPSWSGALAQAKSKTIAWGHRTVEWMKANPQLQAITMKAKSLWAPISAGGAKGWQKFSSLSLGTKIAIGATVVIASLSILNQLRQPKHKRMGSSSD